MHVTIPKGNQVRIHTGFHRFTEIGHIFHIKYIYQNKNTLQVEIWPISHLNDLEIQERGLKGVKIQIISWGSHPLDPAKSWRLPRSFRKSVSIYPRSAPGNMGYVQYTVPDTVAVEPTFVAFL